MKDNGTPITDKLLTIGITLTSLVLAAYVVSICFSK